VRSDGTGGYIVDGFGGIQPFRMGTSPFPPVASGGPYWPGWDIVRGIALLPDGTGGYILDGFGGLHPFRTGSNPFPPPPVGFSYWRGWDIARGVSILPNGTGGYVIDAWGGFHPFSIGSNGAPPPPLGEPYWPGQDLVDDVAMLPGGGAMVVDGRGRPYDVGLPGPGFPGRPPELGRWGTWDIIRGIAALPDRSTLVLDGWGGIHRYAVPSTTAATNYAFMLTDPDGAAVRYDPCAPIHYVIAGGGPPGGVDLVRQSFTRLGQITGLEFIFDGTTSEPASTARPLVNTLLYGQRPSPILVAWTSPAVISGLSGGVVGLGGSAAIQVRPGRRAYVTGVSLLDAAQIGTLPPGFGPGVTQGDVVLHELGHVVGLAHVNDTSELMYPVMTPGPAAFGTGDTAGLQRVGSRLGCIAPGGAGVNPLLGLGLSPADIAPPTAEWSVVADSVDSGH
jgi:hypothetical protein